MCLHVLPFFYVSIVMAFIGGYTVKVWSYSYPLIEDTSTSNLDLILHAVLGNTSIPAEFIQRDCFGHRMHLNAYMQYAEDEYYFGLPSSQAGGFNNVDQQDLITAIEDNLGEDIALQDFSVKTMSATYAALPFLTETRQLDLDTDIIHNPPALNPLIPTDWENIYLYSIDLSTDGTEALIRYLITYAPEAGSEEPPQYFYDIETVAIPAEVNIGSLYCIARFARNATPDIQEWWMYDLEHGTEYPDLGESLTDFQEHNTFMPVIPIRNHNRDLTDEAHQDTDLFKTSEQLLKKMGIDLLAVAAALNDNPDIDEIDHAFITHMVDLQTATPEELYYLGLLFEYIYEHARFSELDYIEALTNNEERKENVNTFEFTDTTNGWIGVSEANFRMSIRYSYATVKTKIGKIGPQFTGTKEIYHKAVQATFDDLDPVDDYFLKIQYQIDETSYKEIIICNAVHRNDIYHDHAAMTGLVSVLEDPDEHGFLLPVHYGLLLTLPKKHQDLILSKTYRIILNSYIKKKIPWYAQGWFQIIKMIIAVALAYFSGGKSMMMLAAEIAAEGVMYVLLMVMGYFAFMMALQVVFNYLAHIIGAEAMAIFSVVIIAASVVISQYFPEFATGNAVTNKMTNAEIMLKLGNTAASATQHEIKESFKQLGEEYEDFTAEKERKLQLLEDAEEMLKPKHLINYQDILQESRASFLIYPEIFYERMVHYGNIGTLVYDSVSNYHKVMLSLPKPIAI